MKKVLITGGSGFIGHHLIAELKSNGYKVLNLDLVKSDQDCEFVQGDIRESLDKVFEGFEPEYVINLAAETSVKPKNITDFTTNIDGVKNLVKAVNKYKVKKTLFYSTQYVYQSYSTWEGYDKYEPFTMYGESKRVGEEIVIDNCKQPYLLLRPTNVWGEGNQIYVDGLFNIINKGYYFHPNRKQVIRSYGYVKNICFQTRRFLEVSEQNRAYYLSDETQILYDFINLLSKEIVGKEIKTLPLPVFKAAALAGDLMEKLGLSFPMNSVRLTNMVSPNPVPIEDTIAVTGKAPFTIDQAVSRTINWYKNLN